MIQLVIDNLAPAVNDLNARLGALGARVVVSIDHGDGWAQLVARDPWSNPPGVELWRSLPSDLAGVVRDLSTFLEITALFDTSEDTEGNPAVDTGDGGGLTASCPLDGGEGCEACQ